MIKSVDHIVLSTADLERCLDFYTRVLGMKVENYGEGRIALRFGVLVHAANPPVPPWSSIGSVGRPGREVSMDAISCSISR